jgi:hypothetical protein
MPEIEMVCLANSRKHQGRCVAGLITDGSAWIRPVSSAADGSLFPSHYILQDGTETQVMDVVHLEVRQHRPENHQPENWVIGKSKWQLVRRSVSVQDYRDLFRKYSIHGLSPVRMLKAP